MPLNYVVEENLLTNPHSYKCRVTPNDQLDYDAVAALINSANPTISQALAKVVLEQFAAVVMEQLLAGNWVVLTNFVSFMTSMPVSLANSSDPLPSSVARLKVKTSRTFKDELIAQATYNRSGYPVKVPSISEAQDSFLGIPGFFENDKSFTASGRNIGFDPSYSGVGLYVRNYDNTAVTRQNVVNLNEPSRIMVLANSPATDGYPEMTLEARNKFTENGVIRTGVYSRKLRGPVTISDATLNLIFSSGSTSSLTTISAYTGSDERVQINLSLTPTDELYMKLRTVSIYTGAFGEWGTPVQVTGDGAYVLDGAASDVTVTFATGGYDIVLANVIAYGRIMNEVCDLEALTP